MNINTVAADGHLPSYAHPGDAGADLRTTEDVVLAPGERRLVGTGVAVAIPDGHVGLVTPRSGLAARAGLSIVNSPGVIDAGYRGEIKVCLINLDLHNPIRLLAGDRVAQLLIMPFVTASFTPVDDLDETSRGIGGYGSTGGFTTP
ncbi:dUTP diphosphatase [Tessaracoccus sp. MC1865]|uniref:dUTP diphosphatase n=1 Tax=Tessaracoccus sp. MC1865 TaxID=2760310 RepID=UPI0016003860|nr:dUTP diphosphatase [Tessaracoccus sp. MC1865]MBB1483321.1 dUTP diphosphatase [Tessaracoccus sp. MC1865]QTO36438.1 dUTP diphosphatase [Tessaracoccus sp. MC1865]